VNGAAGSAGRPMGREQLSWLRGQPISRRSRKNRSHGPGGPYLVYERSVKSLCPGPRLRPHGAGIGALSSTRTPVDIRKSACINEIERWEPQPHPRLEAHTNDLKENAPKMGPLRHADRKC